MAKKKGNHLAVYNLGGVTLTDGDETGLFVSSTGALLTTLETGDIELGAVELKDGTTDARVTAKVDNAAAGTPTPLSVGGKYNASAPTYDDGDQVTTQYDVNGNLKVREQYAPGYEDNTNGVAKVEQRFTMTNVTADTQIKAGAGFLHSVTFAQTDAAPTAGIIVLYDSLTETGTIIQTVSFTTTVFQPYTLTYNGNFTTGLYVGYTTIADINVTVSWR